MIPVSAGREWVFLSIFLTHYLLGVLGIAALWWFHSGVDYLEATKLLAPLIIIATAHSVLLVEGYAMLAERFLERRFNEGKAKGIADANKEWADWLNRKKKAEANNEIFSEPSPFDLAMSQKD